MRANEFRHTILKIDDIWNYVKGGHGKFTMESQESNVHITYKIRSPKNVALGKERPLWVSFLGSNDQYNFIGTIWEDKMEYQHSNKAHASEGSPSVKGIKWLLKSIKVHKDLPLTMAFWHEGVCCRCGRELTHPESIENGIGPVCINL